MRRTVVVVQHPHAARHHADCFVKCLDGIRRTSARTRPPWLPIDRDVTFNGFGEHIVISKDDFFDPAGIFKEIVNAVMFRQAGDKGEICFFRLHQMISLRVAIAVS